jgi:3D (Asp-Asp-Asp) domain-containing protein
MTAVRTGFWGVLALAAGLPSCGGTDYVNREWEAQPLDTSGDWLEGQPRTRASVAPVEVGNRKPDTFRNTYYDFPSEGAGKKDAKVFDAACAPIADVTRTFHDKVCLQGSGKLATGETISFAKRDCACALECPKSGQKICFEKLDPKKFPSGRGALGQPVTPLKTIAVDDKVIPMGSSVYIPEYDGMPKGSGKHDGCFVAEDRGSKVVGNHVDIFTGDPATTEAWNKLVPSNSGVHLELGSPRCKAAN